MQFTIKTRASLVSAIAAAVLAACGGGSSPESTALAPQSAELNSVDLATGTTAAAPSAAKPAAVTDSDVKSRTASKSGAIPSNNLYIVRMADAPAAVYDGKVAGYSATRPAHGTKFNARSQSVKSYRAFLKSKHETVARAVGVSRLVYSYEVAFNGFAAELTDAQAQQLRMTKGVLSVSKDKLGKLQTATTPAFLGLSGPNGFYAKTGAKGEDVVIGMVDSGIWPENAAFTDKVDVNGKPDPAGTTTVYGAPPSSWSGSCVDGQNFTAATNCNNKLIGAKFYNAGWGGDSGITANWNFEFLSPRDWGGHGTHTSSTAGGNEGVPITSGLYTGFGAINGIAPRARIATYKVCWAKAESTPAGGCFQTDSVAAIDQAVSDGVDVINFSISGTATSFMDAVEMAFFNASAAGVFVATAAGNDGPDASTVNHPSPWITTVAADTHNRTVTGGVVSLNGSSYAGATNVPGQITAQMVNASDIGLPGADPVTLAKCFGSADGVTLIDPSKAAGKIVVCDRGTNFLINKSIAVQDAGGVGVVIVNVPGGATTTLTFGGGIPSLHTVVANRDAIRSWASAGTNSGSISGSLSTSSPAPFMADFSSRGPSSAVRGNILKPDIAAPGVEILAAMAPPDHGGRMFDMDQGTSMASPHIAGIAALFKQAHPTWSPMAIKSALMTTAGDVLDGPNTDSSVIFSQGAGHVRATNALDPGLVFDSNVYDWIGFLCGTGELDPYYCTNVYGVPIIDPVNMNTPSIALGQVAYSQTVTRKVTNVGTRQATYIPSASGLVGLSAAFAPTRLIIGAGETKTFTVTFKRVKAALNEYQGGQISLTDGTHHVRIPVVVQPIPLAAPAAATAGTYTVKYGYSGPFKATLAGLVQGTVNAAPIVTNQNVRYDINVPAGTAFARFALFDSDVPGGTDLDLYVYLDGQLVGISGGPTAEENVMLSNPAGGTYQVFVVGFNVPSPTTFKLNNWIVGNTPVGNMKITSPTQATQGAVGKIVLTPTRSIAPGHYFGAVTYGAGAVGTEPTLVTFDK
ncbi:MAG TPA: S8 family serine peptidase [Ramlibacter sp.]|nr:S8 family serine peptidase [Ramlibacter sp.]